MRPGTIRWNSRLEGFKTSKKRPQADQGEADRRGRHRRGVARGIRRYLLDRSQETCAARRPAELCRADGRARHRRRLNPERPADEATTFETVDGSTRIYVMPFTTSSTMWQLSFPMEEKEARELAKDQNALKMEILRRCCAAARTDPRFARKHPARRFLGVPGVRSRVTATGGASKGCHPMRECRASR